MSALLESLTDKEQGLLRTGRPGAEPAARPMLATLSDRRDFDGGWVFEGKLDGIRLLAVRDGGRVTPLSRTGVG